MSSHSKDAQSLDDEFFDKRVIMEIAGIIETNWNESPIDSFGSMNLKDALLRGIFTIYEKPSAIQQRAIAPILKGRDVIVQSQSCTLTSFLIKIEIKINYFEIVSGKAIATCIGILQLINTENYKCQAVILTSCEFNKS